MRVIVFFTAAAGIGFAGTPLTAAVANVPRPPAITYHDDVAYEDIVASLRAEGYTIVSVERTFLGRMKIVAQNGKYLREVIVSSSTGEVKRDVITGRVAADGPGNSGTNGLAKGAGNGQSGNAAGTGNGNPGSAAGSNGSSGGSGNSGGNGSAGGNGGSNAGGNNGGGNNAGGNGNGNNGNGNGNGGGNGSNGGGNGNGNNGNGNGNGGSNKN